MIAFIETIDFLSGNFFLQIIYLTIYFSTKN